MRLAVVVLGILSVFAVTDVSAKGLADLEGKYSGLLLYSQGEDVRVVGTVTMKVVSKRAGKAGTIVLKGQIGDSKFRTKVKLNGRKFTMSSLLPGQFSQRVAGKAKVKRNGVEFSSNFSGDVTGEGKWKIGFDSFGSIVVLSGVVTPAGGTPVYVSFTAG